MARRSFHIVTSVKNEGPYLVEWIAYHRAIGVTDFTIFSNDCTDGTNRILTRLQQMGLIRHFDNPGDADVSVQDQAWRRAEKMPEILAADWVAVIDLDEFINVQIGDQTLDALIDATGDSVDAISINWRFMGSNGRKKFRDVPVIERFQRGNDILDRSHPRIWTIKTLFRPDRFDGFSTHRPWLHLGRWRRLCVGPLKPLLERHQRRVWLNGSGQPMHPGFNLRGVQSTAESVGFDLVQLNHYAVKSREEFLLKRFRGSGVPKNKDRFSFRYWTSANLNTRKDLSIPTDGMHRVRAEMLADPDLAAAHRASVEAVQVRLADLVQDPLAAVFLTSGKNPERSA